MSTNELTKHAAAALEQVPEEHRRRGVAAGVGATIGAVVGSVLGGRAGAAVGGALGGALGVAVGEKSQNGGGR